MKTFTIVESPIGGLVLVADGGTLTGLYHEYHSPEPSPVLLGTPFPPGRAPRVALDRNIENQPHMSGSTDVQGGDEPAGAIFRKTEEWLNRYFDGTVTEPEQVTVPHGTNFQRAVWSEVAAIPYGSTLTYKDIASKLGNEAMGRAVGAAVRANPFSLIIPGHRVVGAGGSITGYAAGVAVKRALLELEAAVAAGSAA